MLGLAALPGQLGLLEAQEASQAGQSPLKATAPDLVADPSPKFFAKAEFADFKHLGDLIMPAFDGKPGAIAAGAPEFLDFLLSESPDDAQSVYRLGIRGLGLSAKTKYQKPFAALTAEQAAPLLQPLTAPWTYAEPKEPVARFLAASKVAFVQATLNSRAWADAQTGRSRSAAGVGTYWLPIE